MGSAFNLVGFQTKMTYPEQKRVFRLIPGLEQAEFLRFGSLHRNTYINSPKLRDTLQFRDRDDLFFAGQITGVRAIRSAAGLGGIECRALDPPHRSPGAAAEHSPGALVRYIAYATGQPFQPMNINFGLLPELPQRIRGKGKASTDGATGLDRGCSMACGVGHASGGMMATASRQVSFCALNTTAAGRETTRCSRDAVHSGISPLPER